MYVCFLLMGGAGARAALLLTAGSVALDAVMSPALPPSSTWLPRSGWRRYEVDETPFLTSMFFVGFIAPLLMEMLS